MPPESKPDHGVADLDRGAEAEHPPVLPPRLIAVRHAIRVEGPGAVDGNARREGRACEVHGRLERARRVDGQRRDQAEITCFGAKRKSARTRQKYSVSDFKSSVIENRVPVSPGNAHVVVAGDGRAILEIDAPALLSARFGCHQRQSASRQQNDERLHTHDENSGSRTSTPDGHNTMTHTEPRRFHRAAASNRASQSASSTAPVTRQPATSERRTLLSRVQSSFPSSPTRRPPARCAGCSPRRACGPPGRGPRQSPGGRTAARARTTPGDPARRPGR